MLELVSEEDTNKAQNKKKKQQHNEIETKTVCVSRLADATCRVNNEEDIVIIDKKQDNFIDMYDRLNDIEKIEDPVERLYALAKTHVQIDEQDCDEFIARAYAAGKPDGWIAQKINTVRDIQINRDDIKNYIIKHEYELNSLIVREGDALTFDQIEKSQKEITRILESCTYENECASGMMESAKELFRAKKFKEAATVFRGAWDLALNTKKAFGKAIPDIKVNIDNKQIKILQLMQNFAAEPYGKERDKFAKKLKDAGLIKEEEKQKTIDTAWADVTN